MTVIGLLIAALILSACAPAATPQTTPPPPATEPSAAESTQAPEPTQALEPTKPIATPSPAALPEPALSRLALIGHVEHIQGATRQLSQMGEFTITQNTGAETADLVLFTVSYMDGPMPQTREEILQLQGKTIARVAVLYTDADQMSDSELQQLVDQEMRGLLSEVMPADLANGLPALIMPGPDFSAQLQELLNRAGDNILLEP